MRRLGCDGGAPSPCEGVLAGVPLESLLVEAFLLALPEKDACEQRVEDAQLSCTVALRPWRASSPDDHWSFGELGDWSASPAGHHPSVRTRTCSFRGVAVVSPPCAPAPGVSCPTPSFRFCENEATGLRVCPEHSPGRDEKHCDCCHKLVGLRARGERDQGAWCLSHLSNGRFPWSEQRLLHHTFASSGLVRSACACRL